MNRLLLSITILIIISTAKITGQTLFNKNYQNTEGSGNWINSSMILRNGEFILNGGYSDTLNGCYSVWSRGAFFIAINDSGEIQTKKYYASCSKKIFEGLNKNLISVEYEIFTCGDIYYNTSDTTAFFIAKLNEQLDTVFYKEYMADTTSKRGWNLASTSDGGIVVCGGVDTTHSEYNPTSTFVEVFIHKTNSDGEFLWLKKYRFFENVTYNYTGGIHIVESFDKGFVVSGICKQYGYKMKNFILKTDSLGNQQWVKFYGTSSYDNPTFTDIIPTHDSCFIVCGAYTYGEIGGGYYPYDAWILKIDNNGNTKWDIKHRDSITSGITSNDYYGYYQGVVEAENGNLFTICRTKSDLVGAYRGSKFRIRQLDYQGNRIGDKFIDSVGDQSGSLNPQSIIITPDGDLAVGGWGDIYYYDEENNWVSDQRIFLVKTDTCFQDTLLNNIISYNPKPITEFKLQCYPNPASSEFFVDLPKGIDDDVLEIYSTSGSLVWQQNVGAEINRVEVCGIKPGMYLVRIRGANLFGKIIVN